LTLESNLLALAVCWISTKLIGLDNLLFKKMSIYFRFVSMLALSLGALLRATVCAGDADLTNGIVPAKMPFGILTVHSSGTGTITPNYNGQELAIGRTYGMTATGRDGFNFTNWTITLTPVLRMVPQDIHEIQTNGSHFLLRNSANRPLNIEYSSNLLQWSYLQTTQLNGNEVEIVDSSASNAAMRFYRASSEWTTNSPTVFFVMQSNIILTANFKDVQVPVLAITVPTQSQRITNAVTVVQGTTYDNGLIVAVWYRLNDNAWDQAEGTTNWSAQVNLLPGRNTLQAFAVDSGGNRSFTNSLMFNCFLSDQLSLITNGVGSITRNFAGSTLPLGFPYTVTAVPGRDHLFAGWSGTISAPENPLTFTMQSNMILEANFAPNPFIAPKGDYNGLFYPADMMGGITGWADTTNSGFLKLALTTNGGFNGELLMEGTNRPFSGTFDLYLQAAVNVPRPGMAPLHLNLHLDPDSGIINGTVANPQWTSSLLARRAVTGNSNAFGGTYTLFLAGCDSGSCFVGAPTPFGDSPAAVQVSHTGAIQMIGTLADGIPISQNSMVSADGYWPLYVSPYQGKGLLIGWLNFVDYGGVSTVVWQKAPSNANDRYYPNGFSTSRVALVTPYTPPLAGQNAANFTNGMIVINSGNLPVGVRLTNQVLIVNNQLRSTSGSISNLTLAITPSNGLFKGTFLDPVTGKATIFNGALMQSSPDWFPSTSGGWFLGTNTGGTIRLLPR
jgi:hypothetical protein